MSPLPSLVSIYEGLKEVFSQNFDFLFEILQGTACMQPANFLWQKPTHPTEECIYLVNA